MNYTSYFLSASVLRGLSVLLGFFLSIPVLGQQLVSGQIKDGITEAPLPFSTVIHLTTMTGVTSDSEGNFSLQIFTPSHSDSIQISYVGYETINVAITSARDGADILLQPSVTLLDEVIVRPLSPEELLKKVLIAIPENYAIHSFNTIAHYEESIKENGASINHSEGAFKSWFENYQATSSSNHQLVLHREKDTKPLNFMSKKAEKEKAKYLKEHPEDADKFEEGEVLLTNFGGPKMIMSLNVTNKSLDFMDSTKHKNFNYIYKPESTYLDKKLIVIAYTSKGAVDNRKQRGQVFIDAESLAVVSVEEEAT